MSHRIIATLLSLSLAFSQVPLQAATSSSNTCSSSSCSSGSGNCKDYYSCNNDLAAQECANSCGNAFGTTVATGTVYIAGAVAVVAVASLVTVLLVTRGDKKEKKRKKKQRVEEEDAMNLPSNSDLLPSRASLGAVPAL